MYPKCNNLLSYLIGYEAIKLICFFLFHHLHCEICICWTPIGQEGLYLWKCSTNGGSYFYKSSRNPYVL